MVVESGKWPDVGNGRKLNLGAQACRHAGSRAEGVGTGHRGRWKSGGNKGGGTCTIEY